MCNVQCASRFASTYTVLQWKQVDMMHSYGLVGGDKLISLLQGVFMRHIDVQLAMCNGRGRCNVQCASWYDAQHRIGRRWQTTREAGGCASYIHQPPTACNCTILTACNCTIVQIVQLHNCANRALSRYCEQGRGANCVPAEVPPQQLRHLPCLVPATSTSPSFSPPQLPASPVLSPCPLEGGGGGLARH